MHLVTLGAIVQISSFFSEGYDVLIGQILLLTARRLHEGEMNVELAAALAERALSSLVPSRSLPGGFDQSLDFIRGFHQPLPVEAREQALDVHQKSGGPGPVHFWSVITESTTLGQIRPEFF